jgi:hypothetical protein
VEGGGLGPCQPLWLTSPLAAPGWPSSVRGLRDGGCGCFIAKGSVTIWEEPSSFPALETHGVPWAAMGPEAPDSSGLEPSVCHCSEEQVSFSAHLSWLLGGLSASWWSRGQVFFE